LLLCVLLGAAVAVEVARGRKATTADAGGSRRPPRTGAGPSPHDGDLDGGSGS